MTTTATGAPAGVRTVRATSKASVDRAPIPLARLVLVELRKSFDTRSGRWLLASLGVVAGLTTAAIIAWAPADQVTYGQFVLAIGVPMTIILPIIAALSVTSEWTQRTGLVTFTLVPHRGRVLLAKACAAVLVTVPATAAAFGIGALGNLAGAASAGVSAVWDQGLVDVGYFALGQTLLLLVGFLLGALVRSSAGAVVAYMIYGFVAPGMLAFLAMNQVWFADARPWVDLKFNQDLLLHGDMSGNGWVHLAITTDAWLVVPITVAVLKVLRSEVK